MASPRPRPPWARSIVRGLCVKRSKTIGSASGEIPIPSSRTRTATMSVVPFGLHDDVSAVLGVLGGVRQQVRHDLREPGRVAVDRETILRHVHGQMQPASFEEWARGLDGLRDECAHLDPAVLELELSTRDARDIEQVVDQTDQVVTCRSMTLRSRSTVRSARRRISWRAVTMGERGLRSSWPSIARNWSFVRSRLSFPRAHAPFRAPWAVTSTMYCTSRSSARRWTTTWKRALDLLAPVRDLLVPRLARLGHPPVARPQGLAEWSGMRRGRPSLRTRCPLAIRRCARPPRSGAPWPGRGTDRSRRGRCAWSSSGRGMLRAPRGKGDTTRG